MAEPSSLFKSSRKSVKSSSRSFIHYGSTPLSEINDGRLSLASGARLQKLTSNSFERLSFISEKDSCNSSDLEEYDLNYSIYLLRKVQNSVLAKNKNKKEECIQKCFISLKWELEELLGKHVKLNKDIMNFTMLFEVLRRCQAKIEIGKKVLEVLEENNFDVLLDSLSKSLDHSTNQLQLVDINSSLIEEAFDNKVLGSGSELDECLKKFDTLIRKNKDQVSKIAREITEIEKLGLENLGLKERSYSLFENISSEVLEKKYNLFVNLVKDAFKKREELNAAGFALQDQNVFEMQGIFQPGFKIDGAHQISQLSKIESPYPARPNSASTPQPD